MGPIEAELRAAVACCEGRPVQQKNYQFWSGLAECCLHVASSAVLFDAAKRAGVSAYSEDAWSEAIEAAEALGL